MATTTHGPATPRRPGRSVPLRELRPGRPWTPDDAPRSLLVCVDLMVIPIQSSPLSHMARGPCVQASGRGQLWWRDKGEVTTNQQCWPYEDADIFGVESGLRRTRPKSCRGSDLEQFSHCWFFDCFDVGCDDCLPLRTAYCLRASYIISAFPLMSTLQ